MDLDTFWTIITTSYEQSGGNQKIQLEKLAIHLEKLLPEEIISFKRLFDTCFDRAYRHDLWAVAYILGGGCSDDSFMDFRAWLISLGQEMFEAILDNPDKIADFNLTDPEKECFFEEFLYIGYNAYRQKTGIDMPVIVRDAPLEPQGERWYNDEDLSKICPQVWAKYGWEISL